MKILCVKEGEDEAIDPRIPEAAKTIVDDADVVVGTWNVDGEDFGSVIRNIEKEGPEGLEVPQAFKENPDAEIALISFTPFAKSSFDTMKDLHLIGTMRGGLENIEVDEATKRGILVINASGRNANAVAEYTVGMLLAETRSIARSYIYSLEGIARPEYPKTYELNHKTVGLVGLGNIGKTVAKILGGFDMKILAYDPYVTQESVDDLNIKLVDLNTLFKEADFICIHARLLPETQHLVGREQIGLMKESAYLVNTARAGLVDNEALLEALQQHKIAGAALDVFDEEPLPKDSPFCKLDNVTLTPHRAGNTWESMNCAPELLAQRIREAMEGKSKVGVVNPSVLEDERFKEWLSGVNLDA